MLCKPKVFLFAVSVVFILILPGINSFLSVPSGKLSWGNLIKGFNNHQTTPSEDYVLSAGADCNRKCIEGEAPRVCYFKFIMEHYQSMGAACKNCSFGTHEDCLHPQCITVDGYERGVQTINRVIPGTAIEVCLNDYIVVDLENKMEGTGVSIHWHGIHHRQTPFMDGVPYVTQCPIDFETTFRYAFKATQAGTHFYHSHAGHHKANGQYGKLVVREPDSNDPNSNLYDIDSSEYVIIGSDWTHDMAEMYVPGLQSSYVTVQSVLINGKGRYYDEYENYHEDSPLQVIRVKQGKRYRFRFINSGSQICPFQLQIEKHHLTLIANDGSPVRPREFDTLISTSGERYDFVLNANQTIGNYWIRLRAIGPCNIERVEAFGILSYYDEDAVSNLELSYPQIPFPLYDNPFPPGIYMNHPNATCYQPGADYICSSDLQSYDVDEELINKPTDSKFVLRYILQSVDSDFLFSGENHVRFMNAFSTKNFVGTMNKISLSLTSHPLLTQRDETDEEIFCGLNNRHGICKNSNETCFCLHRIKVKLNSTVEIVFIDDSEVIKELNHPLHLHGHTFVITGMGQHFDQEKYDNNVFVRDQPINHFPPKRDTVSVPSHGYAITRMRAINPGFWIIHCHFEWHLGIGMALVLQVGEHEDMVPTPKGFPKCGNYLPDIKPENL